jgi:hypothetical protein
MSALIRPALENGSAPKDAIEVGDGDAEDAVQPEVTQDAPTAVHRVRQPAPDRGPPQPPFTQAGPMLRRLLGWRANP